MTTVSSRDASVLGRCLPLCGLVLCKVARFYPGSLPPLPKDVLCDGEVCWIVRRRGSLVERCLGYPAERTMNASQRWFQLQLVQTSTTYVVPLCWLAASARASSMSNARPSSRFSPSAKR